LDTEIGTGVLTHALMIFCPLTRKSPCEVFGTHIEGRECSHLGTRYLSFRLVILSLALSRMCSVQKNNCWSKQRQ